MYVDLKPLSNEVEFVFLIPAAVVVVAVVSVVVTVAVEDPDN